MDLEVREPHHVDTTVTMCPYFKIQAANLQLWKAQCDSFYERAKNEDGLLFYGFCFEEVDGDCEVHVRQGFRDATSLLAHLRAIDVPIQAALKLSQLERVEVHGPASELRKVEAEQTAMGEAKFQFFEAEAEPLRRASPHAGDRGSDTVVSVCHYYDAAAEVQPRLRTSAAKLRDEALGTPGLEHHSFAVAAASTNGAHLGQGFGSAEAATGSLARDAAVHRQLAEISGKAVRLEVHGPAAELVRGARFFVLDERALRRAYVGSPVIGQPEATIALEVDLQDTSPKRDGNGGGWGLFAACGRW